MQMQTYDSRSHQIAREADVVVMVLLNSDDTDAEFVVLHPRHGSDCKMPPVGEFIARQLRSVGVVGLKGLTPVAAFREALEPRTVDRISVAFLEFIRVLTEKQMEAAEIAELERLWSLPDTRN